MNRDPSAQDCISMLERLVAYDTTSRNPNMELITLVQNILGELDIECRITHCDDLSKGNLWATIGPMDRGGIVLSGHTDVVPVDGQDWKSDPFKLEERDGLLYARGSADMKGFVACCIAHAARMENADLKIPIHFAFSHDEEVGCVGVLPLVEDMVKNLPLPLACIVGEPTSMQIVGGNKGGFGIVTTVKGTDGHSSLPEKGANSIFAAGRIISYLHDMQKRLKDSADPDNGFDPYYTTIDCGIINGGTAHNVIPALTKFNWGFRNIPQDDPKELAQEVFDFVAKEIEPDLKRVSDDCSITHEQRHIVPGLMPDKASPAESLLRHLTGLNKSGRVSYGTEAGHFQNAKVPSVIFGPGNIEQAHLPDEFVAVEQMEACHEFMLKLTDWAASNDRIG